MEWLDNAVDWWSGHWRSVDYGFLAGALIALFLF